MPSWLPEGNAVQPKNNELRTLAQWADALYQLVGNKPCMFPEGTKPLSKDNEDRLEKKINKMLEP